MSKELKEVRIKAKKEAEKIFMKNNPKLASRDGSFPKAGPGMPRSYNKEAKRVEDQVVDTRVRLYKEKLKREKLKQGRFKKKREKQRNSSILKPLRSRFIRRKKI